jgi:transcriptional regulator with AAA-type ATPase domain/polyferredoxin
MDALQLLQKIRFLRDIPSESLEGVARHASFVDFSAGSTVFRAGDPGDTFYVIHTGRVEVLLDQTAGDGSRPVALLGPGDCFGEMALLTGEPRSATIRVLEESRLLAVRRGDFTELISDIAVYQSLTKLLCSRLRHTDQQLDSAQQAQVALSRYLNDSRRHLGVSLSGSTAASRKFIAAVEVAAASDEPVLIVGETGSGKSLTAATIVRQGRRADEAVITVDCTVGGEAASSEIFGHDSGATEGSSGRRIGALELCVGGTVVVAEPQMLPMMAQDRLVKAIRNGSFRRIGGTVELPQEARVIITRCMAHEGAAPPISAYLERFFSLDPVEVPALRRRRKDIPEIAAQCVERHSRRMGLEAPEITPAAMELLLSHGWPGNVAELDAVMQRAVAMASGSEIDTDQVLIHLPTGRGENRFDLLRIPWLARLVRSRWYPAVLQIPATLILGLIIFFCFFGAQDESNPGLQLTWPIWWAALPFSFVLLGRIWCTVCPFSLVASLVQRLGCFKLKLPAFFRWTDIWLMAGLFIFLTWADEFWHYPDVPFYTGVVLLGVFAGTLLMSLLFERRTWCRYLCPLGGVNGVYSSTALAEVRANTDVCGSRCTGHDCIRADTPLACPMLEKPLAIDNNRNCNLCMNCVKACPHNAMHLHLRPLGAEIWEQRKPVLAAGVLAILLVGTMVVHALCRFIEHHGLALEDVPPASWFGLSTEGAAWTLIYVLGMILALVVMVATARISAAAEGKGWKENLAHYGLAFAVLAVLMHIALEGAEFIEVGIPTALALIGERLGGSIWIDDYELFTPLLIRMVQLGIAVSALALTLYVITRVTGARSGRRLNLSGSVHLVAASTFGLVFIWLLATAP